MKICFPVEKYMAGESTVFGHFGSAPSFAVVDSDTGEVSEITNADVNHTHGNCSPLKALQGQSVDCVVVGGIGAGALNKLLATGVSVYKAADGTVGDNYKLFKAGGLNKFNASLVCGGHGAGGGCSHH